MAPAQQGEAPVVSVGNPYEKFTCAGGRFASYAALDALARAYGPIWEVSPGLVMQRRTRVLLDPLATLLVPKGIVAMTGKCLHLRMIDPALFVAASSLLVGVQPRP